jgi:hypothetical protein
VLHRVADATIKGFLARVAAQLNGKPVTNGAGCLKA